MAPPGGYTSQNKLIALIWALSHMSHMLSKCINYELKSRLVENKAISLINKHLK